jgi:hypothetical protein
MLISELIEELQACLHDNGDREVLVAQQPTYPLAANVVQVYDPEYDTDDDGADISEADAAVVWIATSEVTSWKRSPYAPGRAWADALR